MIEVDSMRGGGPCSPCLLPEGLVSGMEADGFFSSGSSSSSSSSSSSPVPSTLGANFIEHRVSRMETLAGVAIRYGVEVADIKRMNGLVTDIQMFAHKSLQIPLPGRHPPSPSLSNDSSSNGDQPHGDVLECFQSLKLKPRQQRTSPAMRNLQGYYGLKPPRREPEVEGTDTAAYRTGRALYLEDEPLTRVSSISDQHSSHHRKTRSLVDVFALANGDSAAMIEATENGEIGRASEKSLRMYQKIDLDAPSQAPELLLKDDISVAFSGRTRNRLALRPKAWSRIFLDSSRASLNPDGDSSIADGSSSVRKSSSTSNLQEPDSVSSSIWHTSKWSLRPDAISRPFFDGLPKSMATRRNKKALD